MKLLRYARHSIRLCCLDWTGIYWNLVWRRGWFPPCIVCWPFISTLYSPLKSHFTVGIGEKCSVSSRCKKVDQFKRDERWCVVKQLRSTKRWRWLSGLSTNCIFSVSCLWKTIDLPGGQINDSSLGKYFSLLFLPATPSSPSRTFEGLFEPRQRSSRALDSPNAERQRYKDTGLCVVLVP